MSLFPLETITVTFRGKSFTVKEMTQAEQAKWASDFPAGMKGRGQAMALRAVFTQTQWTEETRPANEAALEAEPAAFIETLAKAILELSGVVMGEDPEEKKAD